MLIRRMDVSGFRKGNRRLLETLEVLKDVTTQHHDKMVYRVVTLGNTQYKFGLNHTTTRIKNSEVVTPIKSLAALDLFLIDCGSDIKYLVESVLKELVHHENVMMTYRLRNGADDFLFIDLDRWILSFNLVSKPITKETPHAPSQKEAELSLSH